MKRKNPYQMLLDDIQKWCRTISYRPSTMMFSFPKCRLHEGWTLTELRERTAAAYQLGYEVVLESTDTALIVNYRKKIPSIPSRWL